MKQIATNANGDVELDREIKPEQLAKLGIAANDNKPLTIIDVLKDNAPKRVYNLEIESLAGENTHNYFVGDDLAWVHNGLGAYVTFCSDGDIYVGKGNRRRANKSIKKCGPGGGYVRYFKSKTVCGSYRLEHRLMMVYGFKADGTTTGFKNDIYSPGRNIKPGGKCGCR